MERNRQRVRNLAKKEKNRLCFDCQRNGPQSDVVLPVGIFICGRCAGLHRAINGHKVSTIQMARWTNEDVEALEAGGNRRARRKYLAKYPKPGAPTLDASDDLKMEKFIQAAWKDMVFYDPHGSGSPSGRGFSSASRSSSPSLAAVPFPAVQSSTFQSAFDDNQFGSSSSQSQAPTPQPPKAISNATKDLEASPSFATDMDFLSPDPTPSAAKLRKTPASSGNAGAAVDTGLESIFDNPPTPNPPPPSALQPDSNGLGPVDLMTGFMRQVLKQHSLTREEFLTVVQDSLTRLRVPWQQPQGQGATPPVQAEAPQSAKVNPLDAYSQSRPFSYSSPPEQQQQPSQQNSSPMDSFGHAPNQTVPSQSGYGDLGDPFGGPSSYSNQSHLSGVGDVFGGGHDQAYQHHQPSSLVDTLSRPPQNQQQGLEDDIFGNLMGSSGRPLPQSQPVQPQAPAAAAQPPPVDHFSMLNPFQ